MQLVWQATETFTRSTSEKWYSSWFMSPLTWFSALTSSAIWPHWSSRDPIQRGSGIECPKSRNTWTKTIWTKPYAMPSKTICACSVIAATSNPLFFTISQPLSAQRCYFCISYSNFFLTIDIYVVITYISSHVLIFFWKELCNFHYMCMIDRLYKIRMHEYTEYGQRKAWINCWSAIILKCQFRSSLYWYLCDYWCLFADFNYFVWAVHSESSSFQGMLSGVYQADCKTFFICSHFIV